MKPWNKLLKIFVSVFCVCLLIVGIGYYSLNKNQFSTQGDSSTDLPSIGTPQPPSVTPDSSDKVEGNNLISGEKVVTNSDITVTSSNFDETHQNIEQLINSFEATIQSASIQSTEATSTPAGLSTDKYKAAFISLKVESSKREQFLVEIQKLATLSSINTYSYDQTQSYTDIDSRLKNLQVQEERYRELISEAKALNEILMIEPELARIRTDIDSLMQLKETLDDQVNYSMVNITLQETENTDELDKNFFELIQAEWKQNTNQMIYLFQWGVIKLIGFIPYIVVLSPVFILIAVLVKRFKKRK